MLRLVSHCAGFASVALLGCAMAAASPALSLVAAFLAIAASVAASKG